MSELKLVKITRDAVPDDETHGPDTEGLTIVATIEPKSGWAVYFNPIGGELWYSRPGDYEIVDHHPLLEVVG